MVVLGLLMLYLIVAVQPVGAWGGCTPGFWKQEHHFQFWMHYDPDQLVNSVFAADAYVPGTDTLLDALKYKGGPDVEDAAKILLKHAVARLLSISSTPDIQDFIDYTNGVLASGDRAEMLGWAKELDRRNNDYECPYDD